jgi:DnaJ-domain-containing protein 1
MIKRAYRKLALQLHPDKVTGNGEEKKKAADKFAEVGHGESGTLLFPVVRWMYSALLKDTSALDAFHLTPTFPPLHRSLRGAV